MNKQRYLAEKRRCMSKFLMMRMSLNFKKLLVSNQIIYILSKGKENNFTSNYYSFLCAILVSEKSHFIKVRRYKNMRSRKNKKVFKYDDLEKLYVLNEEH